MLVLDDDDLRSAVRSLAFDPLRRGRYALDGVLRRNVQALVTLQDLRHPLRFAYSVKTNPDRELLTLVCEAGLYAEVISPQELQLAIELGFENRTIYNGPQPAWRSSESPGIVFADSIEAYLENLRRLEGSLIGVRVRPPGVSSRFGIDESQLPALCEAIRSSGRRTLGISLHVRPQDFDGRNWRDIVGLAIDLARQVERRTRARVTAFDVGGGKTPLEFDRAFARGDFAWLLRETALALPYTHAIFAEPGQAVVTPGHVFVAPVLEIRRADGRTDVVVDAGYPDLPQITTFPHRVLAVCERNGRYDVELLEPGNDCVLGCTCLEYDIIRKDVRLPHDLDRLRALIVADVGAYDVSMGFDFARGGNNVRHEPTGVTAG